MKEFTDFVLHDDKSTSIFSLGQAGFIVKSKNGQLLVIDPYLSDCVQGVETDHIGYKRLLPKILVADEIIFNVLVCTHFHRDHYDLESVPVLMNNSLTKLYCPTDCRTDIENANIRNYEFVEPGITKSNGDFTLHFINCDHGDGAPKAVGVIIEVDGYRILNIGDSCLRLDRKDEYLSFGDIDVMIGPINGKFGNMSETEHIALANAVKPRICIPCHYGMFASQGGNISKFYEEISKTTQKFLIMGQGEKIFLR